jgi:acetyl esterase/lipase
MKYPLDPELAQFAASIPSGSFVDPVPARRYFEDVNAMLSAGVDTSALVIEDGSVPGEGGRPPVPIRIYRPNDAPDVSAAILQIHGGGFVVGSLDTEHGLAVHNAVSLGVTVVTVDYRLAPEHPYPAGLDDCYAALVWMHQQAAALRIDPARIAVYGVSAGGGLAAALCLLARDRSGPAICFQHLSIPELDDRLDTPSARDFTDTPVWTRSLAETSWDYYLGAGYRRGADDVPVLAAPARATDLSGLPPALVNTMEFDPLRDEGLLYAMQLLRDGVSVEVHSYPGTFHGSVVLPARVSRQQARDSLDALRRALTLPPA